MMGHSRIAVLIPCFNEELTISDVVDDFRAALPDARILVFDNNSTDRTSELARTHGAEVVPSPRQGKGNVVQHMFDVIDADIYVMVDGDSTYPADAAPAMIQCLTEMGADMVVATRMAAFGAGAFRPFHLLGNRLLAWLISFLFHVNVTDVLSGYRIFSRDFVKAVPLMAEGFEIETELTLQAATKRFPIREQPVVYRTRPPGSVSKLNTLSDGVLILTALFKIFKDHKPQLFFSILALMFGLLSVLAGLPPILDYYRIRYVLHVPLAILAAALAILAMLAFGIGLLLSTLNRYHNESFALWRRHLKKGSE